VFDDTAEEGQWRAVDYFVVCDGSVFKLQYYSIDGHFDESELEELLKRIDFESYSKAH